MAPLVVLIIEKMDLLPGPTCDKLQINIGFILVLLNIERGITYSYLVVKQTTFFLGYGFFDMPKPIAYVPSKKENYVTSPTTSGTSKKDSA